MFEIRVPATTANIGCGFDVFGLALDLSYSVKVKPLTDCTFSIRNRGEGENSLPSDEKNLFFKTIRTVSRLKGFPEVGLEVEALNQIPVCRGLGSSAACIVAGVVSANVLAGDVLSTDEIIYLSTQIEGHPDNVIPAIVGGFTVAMKTGDRILYQRYPFLDDVQLVVCIPGYTLITEEMRKILPPVYPREDVIFNLSRVAYVVGSILTRSRENFFEALDDAIHQPFRGQKIPGFVEVRDYLRKERIGEAVISGSGSTILLLLREKLTHSIEQKIRALFDQCGVSNLTVKNVHWVDQGVRVIQK